MHFFYDAQSRPQMVQYTYGAGANVITATYTYTHNLQGDITGMVDSQGRAVVSYSYDAWGKPTGTSTLTNAYDELAAMNPFRYRGYVWDEETGLYYLRSRYYKPEWERFINADTLIGDQKTILSHNIYNYCKNNPSVYFDPNGKVLTLIGRIFMDKQGRQIFNHWMWGRGKDLIIKDSKEWNDYFLRHTGFIAHIKKTVMRAINGNRIVNGEFYENNHLDLSGGKGGGYLTGYDMINGTNIEEGDFELSGKVETIKQEDGSQSYHIFAEYTINDKVNANFKYGGLEILLWGYCKVNSLFLGGNDYKLKISGNIDFDID